MTTSMGSVDSGRLPGRARFWVRGLLALVMSMLVTSVLAWGSDGHQVVASLAQGQLTAKARAEVVRLLAQEPGATLATISTWADERRNPTTASWHYVNFPKDTCAYESARDCPGGQCVVEALNRQLEVLASGESDERRLLALKYVVHFIADVHQPLHAGYAEHRGGNSYQLQAFMKGSNLHALWDVGLIRSLDQPVEVLTARLQSRPVPLEARVLEVSRAAEESCRIVGTPGFYPERRVGADYVERFVPVMEQRLVIAGARLAALLNRAFR